MYTINSLAGKPTLAVGQAADLKIDDSGLRVWLSRCGPDDDEMYPVQFERLMNGRWEDVDSLACFDDNFPNTVLGYIPGS